MVWVQAVIAGAGIATALIGASKERKARRQQEAIAAQEAGIRGQISAETNKSLESNFKTSARLSALSQKQEGLRKQAAIFENTQARRDIIRNTQLARATAVSRASNTGGLTSSGLEGAQASIAGSSALQQNERRFNFAQALQGFQINRDILNTQNAANRAQTSTNVTLNNFNNQLGVLGNAASTAGAKADFGRALFNTGLQVAGNATSMASTFKSLPGLGG